MQAAATETLNHPIEKVWALMSDFGNMSWAPGIERTEVIGEGIGMTRRIHMPGMDPIDEVLASMDQDKHHYSYTIPSGVPMPVSDYRAEVQLNAKGDSQTEVIWSFSGTPEGADEKELADITLGFYRQMIGWIDDALST